jgi:hypothetical protein
MTQVLCKNDDDRDIRVDFYKSNKSGNHKFIGSSMLTMKGLKENSKFIDIIGRNG